MSRFIHIADAMASLNQKVNLIGVVTESGIQRKSKGTDYYVSIRIVDESRPSPALPVNFFTETMDKLPQGITEGDIILLSKVLMKIHGPDVYACFNKKYSSFALYEGKNSTSFEPYQCSDKFCPIEQVNKKIILDLRKWLLAGHQIDAGLTDLLQLEELKEGVGFSLVCKVLHVCETEGDHWMLFVWDGTDTPPVAIKSKSYNGRFSSRRGHKVFTCFPCHSGLTETSCSRKVPFITLMNVLTYPEVTYKYRCVVRVVATVPWRVSDFRSPSKVYKIRLTLEDPTARIRAFLYKDDAEEFFARFPSPDDVLTREWNALLGIPNTDDCSEVGDASSSRHPPWIDCCLKSYYIDKNDVWGSRYYQIFSTTLVGRPQAAIRRRTVC
ncbi:PREDICTED: protection of telomeres protein 1a-like isoform X6 [Ipomoea nil]|uniref:protection of telomeres protein 1a-like isoform X6 n=1 Tax=Ipomoea nil TaxID=35883 RepID=UPI000901A0D0|nr:PREDICTED: protection of telomeres protein 1a-like isoform X6 [Ipomoea nil]